MAVAYESDGGVGFASPSGNGSIALVSPPVKPLGSVILLVVFSRLITDTLTTPPAGFTLLSGFPVTSATASGGRLWVYAKEVVGGETSVLIALSGVTGNSGDLWGGCQYCYSGVDLSGGIANIFDGTPTVTDASGTTTCTYPALTIATANAMLIRTLVRFRDAADTFTPTATWNEREDGSSTNRTGAQHHLQDKLATASGAQAAVTVAPSNTTASRYLAVTLALKQRVAATVSGAATLTGTGGLSATGTVTTPGAVVTGAASLAGTGALSATGSVIPYAPPGEAGDVYIPAPAHVVLTGEVLTGQVLTGETLPADTWVDQPLALDGGAATTTHSKTTSAALTGAGSLSASGRRTVRGFAALTGVGSLSATGLRKKLGQAALTGLGSLQATGIRTKYGAAALVGNGNLVAAGIRKKIGAAFLTGLGSLTAYGRRGRKGQAALSGQGTLLASPSGFNVIAGQAALTGKGTLSVSATAKRDVHIPETLFELITGPTILTGQYLTGHIFSGDRWVDYQYDLLGNTVALTLDRNLLVETGTLELATAATEVSFELRIQLADSAALELLADPASLLINPALIPVLCQDVELVAALEAQLALTPDLEGTLLLATASEGELVLAAAPTSTILMQPVACEEG